MAKTSLKRPVDASQTPQQRLKDYIQSRGIRVPSSAACCSNTSFAVTSTSTLTS